MGNGLRTLAIAGLLIGTTTRLAHAEPAAIDLDPATSFTGRMQLLTGATFSGDAYSFLGTGASVAGRFWRLLEVEGGVTAGMGGGSVIFGRTGVSFRLGPTLPTRWSVRIPLLVTYVYVEWRDGEYGGGDAMHGWLFSTGIDATRWITPRLGFDLRFLAGLGGGISREIYSDGDVGPWGDTGKVVDLSLTVGLSFQ